MNQFVNGSLQCRSKDLNHFMNGNNVKIQNYESFHEWKQTMKIQSYESVLKRKQTV